MLQLLCTVLFSTLPLEDIKVDLFERWSESGLFPMVSFGLPSKQETQEVQTCLEDLVRQLNVASGGSLSEEERSVELPFLSGMVAGLHPSGEEHAQLCLKHLEGLDDVVFGFSASKLWRMRLQAYITLGDSRAAQHASQELRSLRDISIEDQTVLALFDISELLAGAEPRIEAAIRRFSAHDQSLIKDKHFYLRDAFASGTLRLMNSTSGKKKLLNSRFSHDKALYQDSKTARDSLRAVNKRLAAPLEFLKSDADSTCQTIAQWNEIDALPSDDAKRVAPLIELSLSGNHEASVEFLSTFAANPIVAEHVDVLFENAVVSNDSNVREYWILQRAIHCINSNKREEGLQFLYLIPKASNYAEEASSILRQIHELNVDSLVESLKQSANHQEANSALVQSWSELTRLRVAKELVVRTHKKSAQWNLDAIEAILVKPSGLPNHLIGELFRLIGDSDNAVKFFSLAIKEDGKTIETLAGHADVTRDIEGMKRILRVTAAQSQKSYWYWLANLRLIEWHLQDGGGKVDAIAKVNRLRKMDASLGGTHFQHLFNELCE